MSAGRRRSRVVRIGTVAIGGRFPVAIQSMTKVKTSDAPKVIAQANALAKAGCEIIRVAVKDLEDARAIAAIRKGIRIPLVADIHFDYRLALAAIEAGADKIRLNPGNIYKKQEVEQVVSALKQARIPLRVGAKSGSIAGAHTRAGSLPKKLAEAVLSYVRMIEKMHYRDIVISLKASTVMETVEAYRHAAKVCDYPLHLGVTATGAPRQGAIKSAIALGILLHEGIGDTLRISLTDDPKEEIVAARAVLEALELRAFGHQVVSCPTCGRCEVDVISVVNELERRFSAMPMTKKKPLKVAVMGCVVNGPGEACEADIGVAFGKKEGLLFKGGKAVKKVAPHECVKVLLEELEK
jgi:(E)-4-hydroxy-3-methylbut-2-enyl-diphosphate synthase